MSRSLFESLAGPNPMTEALQRLINALRRHAQPLGPCGSLDDREELQRAWGQSLTSDDCLALLRWIEAPQLPLVTDLGCEIGLPELVDRAAYHAGCSGRRPKDPRITGRLLELVAKPEFRGAALNGLIELRDASVFEPLLAYLGRPEHRLDLCVALASSATREQIERLGEIAASPDLSSEWRAQADEVVAEWRTDRAEAALERDPI